MAGVFGFAAIWGLGLWRRWPRWALRAVFAGWWAILMLASSPLAEGGRLQIALGGRIQFWTLVGIIGGLVMLYRSLLPVLRRHAAGRVPAKPAPVQAAEHRGLSPDQQRRYARHILLRDIGGPGQLRLSRARVLVVGAGGLGAPVLMYLAAAGIGRIGIVDPDRVELSNLQRQIIHATARLGESKVASAAASMTALNPEIMIDLHPVSLNAENAAGLVAGHDLVIEGCDDFPSRLILNRACVAAGIPLISGALAQWEGQLSLYDPARGGPCLECLHPVAPGADQAPSCAQAGVMAALPGVVGTMMAAEAIKYLTKAGTGLRGRLALVDLFEAESRVIRTRVRAECACCGGAGA